MAGLVGILKIQDDGRDTENLLPDMCRVIKHEDWYTTDTFTNETIGLGRVSLGILNPEPQPIFNEDRSLCIMMEGEVYDYDNLKEELISRGHKFLVDNDPEFILHLYEECGEDFVHKLNGSFVLIIWDNKKQMLLIANDRYGLRPLYYTKHDSKLLFSSEVKAILEDKTFEKVVNDTAVVDFFSFGYILGNKTFFRGVELLPPASILVWQKGQISIKQYWDIRFNEEKEHSEEYYVEKLSKLWLKAVERRLQGDHRIVVPLSGGLDSRAIVGAIDKINKKHLLEGTYTFGKPSCDDVRFARLVSNKLGIKHYFYELKPDYLVYHAEKAVYLTDGMFNCIHAHGISSLEDVRKYSNVALSGFLGDVLLGGRGLWDLTNLDADIDQYKCFGSPPYLDILENLFSRQYYSQVKGYLQSSLKDIENDSIKDQYKKLEYFNTKQRQRRLINYGQIMRRSKVEVRYPFCDNDLVDFVYTIPLKLRRNYNLYIKFYKKIFPELARIACQRTGCPIAAGKFHLRVHEFMQKIKRFINRKLKKFGFDPIFEDTKNYADYDKWMRENRNLRNYIYKILLDERTLSRHYFNGEYIKEILELHMSGKKNYYELIGLLLTFELWHRMFVDEK